MIKIVADTTSTISPEDAKSLGIYYLPQIIVFGEDAFRDDYELSSKEFLLKLRSSSQLPKTAAPSPALYLPIFEELAQAGHTIIVLCPSAKVSGTFNSASEAAMEFPAADIHVIDTQTIGPALGTLVMKAYEWAKDEKSSDFIVESIQELGKKVKIYFYVDTLEYLHRGGRIGSASAFLGSLLQVKPILLFNNGQVTPFEKQRTKKKALERIVELVKDECPSSAKSHLAILEADAMDDAIFIQSEFQEGLKINDIPIVDLPPAIVVHAGPGVVAASFFVY